VEGEGFCLRNGSCGSARYRLVAKRNGGHEIVQAGRAPAVAFEAKHVNRIDAAVAPDHTKRLCTTVLVHRGKLLARGRAAIPEKRSAQPAVTDISNIESHRFRRLAVLICLDPHFPQQIAPFMPSSVYSHTT
jgi:hypothetical protein